MQGFPDVSIVIPAYNAQEWIADTLHSVIVQTYDHRKLEIIVVDDGSTDDTAKQAISTLEKETITWRVIKSGNRGPSHARNLGWRKARGTWIQFLDADDLIHPQKIARQINEAVTLSKDVAVIYSEWQRFLGTVQRMNIMNQLVAPAINNEDAVADLLKTENFIATGSQLFCRSWLEKVGGYDERYRLIEDVHLLLRIAIAGGQFYYASSTEPLFLYRQHLSHSLSRRNQLEFMEGCLRNARLAEEFWSKEQQLTNAQKELLAGIYYQAAHVYASQNEQLFQTTVDKLEKLSPGFIPAGPAHLKIASQLIGYRKAEILISRLRRAKQNYITSYRAKLSPIRVKP